MHVHTIPPQVPAIMTGTISVEALSGAVSICGGPMVGVGVAVADGEGITDLVLVTVYVALDGVGSVRQSI